MRKLALIIAIISPILSYTQSKSPDTGLITYSGVVQAQGSDNELYDKAKNWFVNAYRDASAVIQIDSEEDATIVGKGVSLIMFFGHNRHVYHTIKIQSREGRYKYTIDHITVHWITDGRVTPLEDLNKGAGVKKLQAKIANEITTLIQSLEQAMKLQPQANDW